MMMNGSRHMITEQLPIMGPQLCAQEMVGTAHDIPRHYIPASFNEDTGNYKIHIPPEQLEGIEKGGLPVVEVQEVWDPDGPAPERPDPGCKPCEEAKKVREEVKNAGKEVKL